MLAACNMPDNPINPAYTPDVIQSEEKWESDLLTLSKEHKVYYKEFDKAGNILLFVEFNKDADTTTKSVYTYQDDQSTEIHFKYDNNGFVSENFKIKYRYNNSKIVEKKQYDSDGELEESWSFDYNQKGDLIKTVQEDLKKGVSTIKNYNNEYNTSGNLTGISYDIIVSGDNIPNANVLKDSIVYSADQSIKFYKIDQNGNVNKIYSYIYDTTGKLKAEIISDSKGAIQKRYDFYYVYFK
jgi:hypothetical protein